MFVRGSPKIMSPISCCLKMPKFDISYMAAEVEPYGQ